MTKAKIKKVKHGPSINLGQWNLASIDDVREALEGVIKKAAAEALSIAAEERARAYFPIDWDFGDDPSDGIGGKPPAEATTVYVTLPLGDSEDDEPTWEISLAELVDYSIRGAMAGDDTIAPEQRPALVALRDGLAALANTIDRALTSPPQALKELHH